MVLPWCFVREVVSGIATRVLCALCLGAWVEVVRGMGRKAVVFIYSGSTVAVRRSSPEMFIFIHVVVVKRVVVVAPFYIGLRIVLICLTIC